MPSAVAEAAYFIFFGILILALLYEEHQKKQNAASRRVCSKCQFNSKSKSKSANTAKMTDHINIATLDSSIADRLPAYSRTLFEAKGHKKLSFEQIASELGRGEVAVAALFYGQAQASAADLDKLSSLLEVPRKDLEASMAGFPDRGRSGPMPPVEPLIYRLYEVVQNYGYAFKSVMNEKFGDGIMSAIAFSTNVEKEVDADGVTWVNINLRGKWLPFTRF